MVTRDHTMTMDEFRAFCDLPENRDRLFELIDGEILEKMGSTKPSYIAAQFIRYLLNFVEPQNLGTVRGADGSYYLYPQNMLIPDVAFISLARLPTMPVRETLIAPDFAVEVKSPMTVNANCVQRLNSI